MKFNTLIYSLYKDQFNLYNLIKKINPYYKLFFNKKDKMFCIINTNNNNEICYSSKKLTSNIFYDLQFSQISNYYKIIDYIDKNNEFLEKENILQNNKKTYYSVNEFKRLNNRSTNINKNDIDKIIGAIRC